MESYSRIKSFTLVRLILRLEVIGSMTDMQRKTRNHNSSFSITSYYALLKYLSYAYQRRFACISGGNRASSTDTWSPRRVLALKPQLADAFARQVVEHLRCMKKQRNASIALLSHINGYHACRTRKARTRAHISRLLCSLVFSSFRRVRCPFLHFCSITSLTTPTHHSHLHQPRTAEQCPLLGQVHCSPLQPLPLWRLRQDQDSPLPDLATALHNLRQEQCT